MKTPKIFNLLYITMVVCVFITLYGVFMDNDSPFILVDDPNYKIWENSSTNSPENSSSTSQEDNEPSEYNSNNYEDIYFPPKNDDETNSSSNQIFYDYTKIPSSTPIKEISSSDKTSSSEQSSSDEKPSSIDTSSDESSSSSQEYTGMVNINTASLEILCSLDGIGEVTARNIIAFRENFGKFTTINDLKLVSGIGEKKFLAIKDRLTV